MVHSRSANVIELPKWVLIIRGFQILFAIIIMGITAYCIYWIALDALGFALFTALATMVIALYAGLTSYVASCKPAYNYWAILGLDIFGVVFWLSSMAALAAARAGFIYPTDITGCDNYGYGGVCYRKRELVQKRAVATYGYLDLMSGTAGLSAIEMLLFIATLAIFSLRLHRARGAPGSCPRATAVAAAAASAGGGLGVDDKSGEEAHHMNPVAVGGQYDPPQHQQGYHQTTQQAYDPALQSYQQQQQQQQMQQKQMHYEEMGVRDMGYAGVGGQQQRY